MQFFLARIKTQLVMEVSRELEHRIDGLSLASGSGANNTTNHGGAASAVNRTSKQYVVKAGGSSHKPFIPGSGAATGIRSIAASSTSYFTGSTGGPSGTSSVNAVKIGGASGERGPLTRVGNNHLPSSTSLTHGLGKKPSVDKLNQRQRAAPTIPSVDVGRYDGGLERDERKGRRTGDHSEVLDVDSATGG